MMARVDTAEELDGLAPYSAVMFCGEDAENAPPYVWQREQDGRWYSSCAPTGVASHQFYSGSFPAEVLWTPVARKARIQLAYNLN